MRRPQNHYGRWRGSRPRPDRGPRAAPLEGRLRDGLIAWHKAQTARSSKPKLRSSFSDRLSIGATTSLLFRSEADSLTASRLCVPRVARAKLVCFQCSIKMATFQARNVRRVSLPLFAIGRIQELGSQRSPPPLAASIAARQGSRSSCSDFT